MRYLGGINAGYALLSLLRFIPLYGVILSKGPNAVATSSASREVQAHLDILALTALGLANASQAYCNFFVAKPSNRWIVGTWRGSKTDRITILDAFFTVLDFSIVGARLAGF
jgi:ribosome modulation factor